MLNDFEKLGQLCLSLLMCDLPFFVGYMQVANLEVMNKIGSDEHHAVPSSKVVTTKGWDEIDTLCEVDPGSYTG